MTNGLVRARRGASMALSVALARPAGSAGVARDVQGVWHRQEAQPAARKRPAGTLVLDPVPKRPTLRTGNFPLAATP